MGCTDSLLYSVVFVFAQIVFMGMAEVAAAFADPFGMDDVDFPVGVWLTQWLRLSVTCLESDALWQASDWRAVIRIERPLARDFKTPRASVGCDLPLPHLLHQQASRVQGK